jgi:hypothetical protein
MRRPEDALQRAVVDYLRSRRVFVAAVPNAAQRTPGGRAANGVPGLLPGFPDLITCHAGGVMIALELKAPPPRLRSGKVSAASPRVSDDQLAVMNTLHRLGFSCYVVRSIEDVDRAFSASGIEGWGGVTRS